MPCRDAAPPTIPWPWPELTAALIHVRPSDECHAVAATSLLPEPTLLPIATSPPLPSALKPCATNLRPEIPNEPSAEIRVQLEPSGEDQTVVSVPVVPSARRLSPNVAKYGPKSKWAGGLAALFQLTW